MKLRWWRKPAPVITGVEPEVNSACYFHGPETLDDHTYRVCGECGHVWTVDDLVAEHNKILAYLTMRPPLKLRQVDTIDICPLCTHDF